MSTIRRRSSARTMAVKKRKTRKVILIGSTKCGKTSLIKRFLDNSYSEVYIPTVEECYNRDYKYKGFNLNLDIIDMCGPFVFPVMRDLNIKSADVIMLLYEVDNEKSIQEALAAYNKIYELQTEKSIVLVGTKADLYVNNNIEEYEMSNKHFSLLSNLDLTHVLTSAKKNSMITDPFELGLDEVIKKVHTTSLTAIEKTQDGKLFCCVSEKCVIC